jgi:hypothetical protein
MIAEGITREFLDELQQIMAERLVARGVERVITDDILKEIVDEWLEVGKKELEAIGPEDPSTPDSSKFVARATILTGTGHEADVSVAWNEGHKKRMMYALSETCKTTLAQGVVFRNVVTIANSSELAKRIGLNHPDPTDYQKMRYFEERMWKWIEQNYGKQRLAALPPELRADGLICCGMGPKLHDYGKMLPYQWVNGKLEFGEAQGHMMMMLIPRWWQ